MDCIDAFLIHHDSRSFIESVEKYVSDYMMTKRAVFWLCSSKESSLYRIELNEEG